MRRAVLAFLLAVLSAAAAPAAPSQPPPPPPMLSFQGKDQVLIGRIYWRESGQTQPLARFGAVLDGKNTNTSVPVASEFTGSLTLSLGAKRDGPDAAQVSWSIVPGAGARISNGQGRLTVSEGSIGHAALGTAGSGELFASLETGRASAFNIQRLWEHFGVVTDYQRFAQPQFPPPAAAPAWTPPGPAARSPAPAAAPLPPKGGTFTVSCPSGRDFDLSTGSGRGRCELDVQDGNIVGGSCDDGDGNSARASCTLNGGEGACVSSSGSGDCSRR